MEYYTARKNPKVDIQVQVWRNPGTKQYMKQGPTVYTGNYIHYGDEPLGKEYEKEYMYN